jgi:hypothetical protein
VGSDSWPGAAVSCGQLNSCKVLEKIVTDVCFKVLKGGLTWVIILWQYFLLLGNYQ